LPSAHSAYSAVHSTSASGSVNFLDSVVRASGRGRIRLRREARRDRHIADEPALVACTCSPAKLLGCLNLVGTPRCSDARRYHSRGWHTQRAPAAMASRARSSCRCPIIGSAERRPLSLIPRAAVLGRRRLNESLTPCSWTGRQAGSNAAQRILKHWKLNRPHAGTYIEARTTKRPTTNRPRPL
jgi:hypothetical protein